MPQTDIIQAFILRTFRWILQQFPCRLGASPSWNKRCYEWYRCKLHICRLSLWRCLTFSGTIPNGKLYVDIDHRLASTNWELGHFCYLNIFLCINPTFNFPNKITKPCEVIIPHHIRAREGVTKQGKNFNETSKRKKSKHIKLNNMTSWCSDRL